MLRRLVALGALAAVLLPVAHAAGPIPTRTAENVGTLTGAESDPMRLPSDIAIGKDGMVYVVDSGHHRVAVFDARLRFQKYFSGRGQGPGELLDPVGIGADASGRVYVADKGNHRIQVFDAEGVSLRAVPLQSAGRAIAPVDVAPDAAGETLYVTSGSNHRLMAFNPSGKLLRQWGGEGANAGEFRYPATVALGADGRIYVVDVFNTRVQVFDPRGGVYEVGSWGVLPGQLVRPKGVALDRAGRVYVSDSYLDVVQGFDSGYRFQHVLGRDGRPSAITSAAGIVFDARGRLYVAEMLKHRVSVLELAP